MSKLRLSEDLALPLDAVTQKFAILGRTGSGKSYAATKLCEEMLDAKAQVIAIDPVGVWYGLRIAGKDAPKDFDGYNIPIFGGLHGDVPLEPGAGEFIANLIVDRAISAVIDVSQFESDTQKANFARAFATKFFFRKKSAPSAVHIFLEEAQEFVPQNPQRDEAQMLHAFHRIAKLGRNFGIGATLITQRPQEVNKKALNQTECLLAFQMTGPQERKAIENWIAEKGVNEDITEILPHLKVGQCHIWSPQWLQVDKTIRIAKKKTADVSSTPQHGTQKKAEPKPLSQGELEALSEKMLATIERAKQEDPKELRREVTRLRIELAKGGRDPEKPKVERKEIPVLKDSQLDKLLNYIGCVESYLRRRETTLANVLSDSVKRMESDSRRLEVLLKPINEALAKLTTPNGSLTNKSTIARAVVTSRPADPAPPRRQTVPKQSASGATGAADGTGPSGGLRRIMVALAQRPNGLTARQIGVFAGLSSKGGSFSTYLSRARSNGWIEGGPSRTGDLIRITQTGIDALGNFEMLPTGELLYQYWLAKLGGSGAARILTALHDVYPNALTKEEIGQRANISSAGGSFSTYVSRLRSLELISGNRELRASEELFE
jgi:hypothetical protein